MDGWCVVEIEGKLGMGCSAKVQIPDFISNKIQTFGELSQVVKQNYPSSLIEQIDSIGTNGVITNRAYTRVDEFIDALNCAFGFLGNEEKLCDVMSFISFTFGRHFREKAPEEVESCSCICCHYITIYNNCFRHIVFSCYNIYRIFCN